MMNESQSELMNDQLENGTMIFPPRFRFQDTKVENLERNKIWNSYFDVTPNINPLKAVFSRHLKNSTQERSHMLIRTSRNQSSAMFIPSQD